MKNSIILSGLLFLLCLPGYSQTSFGVKAGANLATIHREHMFGDYAYKHRIGFHIGAIAERSISEKTFIRSELFLSQKGSRFYDAASNISSDQDEPYLCLPLLLGYKPLAGLSIYLGPELSYALGHSKDYRNDYKDFDFGLNGGVVYNLTNALALDLRYTYGLVKMSNVKSTPDDPIFDGQNRVAQLGINYYFKRN